MANDAYVKIEDRVRVVDRPWPVSELLLLMQSGDMRVEAGELRGPLEEKAVLIRKAMECFGVAVRERCAVVARSKCLACSGHGCEYCRHQSDAIRELEL